MRVAVQQITFKNTVYRSAERSAATQYVWAIGCLMALVFPRVAAAEDGGVASDRAAFQSAMALTDQDDAEAARSFEALARRFPEGEFAPDALLEAAQLAEEKLGRPDHAAALYGEVVERYPSSRLSIRARARRDFLLANLGDGPAPLAEYQDILLRFSARTPEDSRARMERLVAAHPGFPLADEGRLWLARADLEAGRFEEAMVRFEAIERHAGAKAIRDARKGRADAALAAGHRLLARDLYRSLLEGDRDLGGSARAGLAAASTAIAEFALFVAALIYLAGFFGACAWQARGGLGVAPPAELKFFLPVALLFLVAGLRATRPIFLATTAIASAGAVVIWLGGVATIRRLDGGPLSIGARSWRALATAIAVLAITYSAIHVTRLTDVVLETLRHGPDR